MAELPDLPRFWISDGAPLELADAGFVPDPESRWAFAWVPKAHSFEAIENLPCLVLIGEPGLGKTTALRREHDRRVRTADRADEVLFVDLSGANEQSALEARIFDAPEWRRWQESV